MNQSFKPVQHAGASVSRGRKAEDNLTLNQEASVEVSKKEQDEEVLQDASKEVSPQG